MPSERTRRMKTFLATIAVTDQITRDLLPTTCFSQLVGDPLCCGVCGDAEPQNLPAVKTHDQQPVSRNETVGTTNRSIAAIPSA